MLMAPVAIILTLTACPCGGNTFNAVQQQDRAQVVVLMPTRDASYFQQRMSEVVLVG